MIWAFEVAGAQPGFSRRLFEAALHRGVLLRPIGGRSGSTVYFMPPYVISDGEMDWLVSNTLAAIEATP
jgi:adenosylmethionine-8-amino-7-oxononanoate aminotransferase